MTPLLTCKQFLQELSDYLDDTLDPATRAKLQKHVDECPNCWVVCNTTEKTIKVYKGMEAQPVPAEIESRLMQAIEMKCKARRAAKAQEEKPLGRVDV
jgi:anti-sigma factor (TIGR02949 family)